MQDKFFGAVIEGFPAFSNDWPIAIKRAWFDCAKNVVEEMTKFRDAHREMEKSKDDPWLDEFGPRMKPKT